MYGLTDEATSAHIHLGGPGTVGRVLARLCGRGPGRTRRCRDSMWGSVLLPEKFVEIVERHGAYVDFHTAKNPRGELRGQLELRWIK